VTGPTLWCVVPAAGRGVRAGGDLPKQYRLLAGRPLIEHTLERLAAHPRIGGLLVTLAPDDRHWPGLRDVRGKPVLTATGGGQRSESVLAGLDALPAQVGSGEFVLVHDAARPCVRLDDIGRLVELGTQGDGGLLGAPLRDTLKHADGEGRVERTDSRESRWRAFTPRRAATRSAAAS
jgi:2-C-methyl-D-erythritol 4-phosphate cytidylyltransferase